MACRWSALIIPSGMVGALPGRIVFSTKVTTLGGWFDRYEGVDDGSTETAVPGVGVNCRSGCPTPGLHASWGECARAASIRLGQVDRTFEKKWDRELRFYAEARAGGLQPAGTRMDQSIAAMEATYGPDEGDGL